MPSTLIAHCGGTLKTRSDLALIPTPDRTNSWTPVPHHELVGSLIDELGSRGISIAREQYATNGRSDAKLFGVLDLRFDDHADADIRAAVGLRTANDKSMALQLVAAARVFVCDNMCFSGSEGAVVLKKRHSGRLDLSAILPPALDAYLAKQDAFRLDIDRMKDFVLADDRAKALLCDAFAGGRPLMPIRLFPLVHQLYFDDEEQRAKFADRSLWSLSNSFTEAVKRLPPVPQQSSGLAIGRFFGRVIKGHDGAQVSLAAPAELAIPSDQS